MNRTRTIAAAAAVTATVAGGLAVAAGSAAAMPTDTNTCQPGDVTAKATEAAPQHGAKVFNITFTSVNGDSCVLTGAPQDLTFHDASGASLGVPAPAAESSHQELVTAQHPVVSVIRTPDATEQGAPASSASFTMANSGKGVTFQIGWPDDVNGPAYVGLVNQSS